MSQIGESLELLLANVVPAPDAVELRATLDRTIERMRIIEGSLPAAVWQQTVNELEAYLGDFAGVLSQESSEDPSRLLENAGPLLASFLGADAAAAVESRIRRLFGDSPLRRAGPSGEPGSSASAPHARARTEIVTPVRIIRASLLLAAIGVLAALAWRVAGNIAWVTFYFRYLGRFVSGRLRRD